MQNRKRNRLEYYDYSNPGLYFVTICTKNKIHWFGEIVEGRMILNEIGKIAEKYLKEIPNHFENVEIDTFVVMPNHIHAVIRIKYTQPVGDAHGRPLQVADRPQMLLSKIINGYKSSVTRIIR